MNNGPVLIVDDDIDDREFLQDAWKDLHYSNTLIFMDNGEEALEYLQSAKTPPFLILCAVNLPKMDGFALKQKIYEDTEMNYRSIPFVFWSSQPSKAQIQKAYDYGVNGFFIKGSQFEEIKQSLLEIVQYWRKCITPY
jgi:CheY-like chemotaxis protein